jgi:hypothetical protein
MSILSLLVGCLGLSVVNINHVAAKTTWELWKRLFEAQNQDCDFAKIALQNRQMHYVAGVQSDEVLCIVACTRDTLSTVKMHHIGHRPNHAYAARKLVAELHADNYAVSWVDMASQPVWLLELLALQ